MVRLRRPSSAAEHEGTLPLINVVFLLLVFFMVAGALERMDAFPIEAPRTGAGETSRPDREMVLIGADGQLAYGSEILPSVEALADRIAQARADGEPQPLTVKADAGAEAATVVAVLHGLRAAGILRVTLLTERR
jgi:biopolymer transport protein ExbD